MVRVLIVTVLFFFCAAQVYAARSISISSTTTNLTPDQTLTVTASMSGFTHGEQIYIKGAFFAPGTSNYFGYTQLGDTWVKNSAANASQRQVTIGSWDGFMVSKNDPADSGFTGEGDYQFKLRFYYGDSLTAEWSTNALTVHLVAPTPTSTTAPTQTPGPTQTPIATVTNTPAITPTKTPTPTTKLKATLSPTAEPTIADAGVLEAVDDGVGKGDDAISLEAFAGKQRDGMDPLTIVLLFVGAGFGLLTIAALWHNKAIWQKFRKPKEE